jgi:DnaK suppressor protein
MVDRTRTIEDEEQALTPDEVEEFRALLEDKRSKILSTAKDALSISNEEQLRMSDEVDLASAEYEAAFEYRLRDREKSLLKKIQKAIDRINAGEYNECEDCGGPIGKNRLRARPETTMCIECKEEQEKKEKMYQKKRNRIPTVEF